MAIQIVSGQIRSANIITSLLANNAVTPAKSDLSQAWTFTAAPQSTVDPSADNDLVRKSYLDGLINGLHWKESCKAATTANITLSGTQTIDGISLQAGDRCLVKNQTTQTQNGVYVVAAGAWARSSDLDANSEFPGAAMFVKEGSTQADQGYICTNDSVNLGSTNIAFTQFTGAYSITAGAGLSKAANSLSVNVDDSSIEIASDALRIKDNGVVTAKIASNAVDSSKIASNAVIAAKIASNAVESSKIASAAVSTAKIADNAVSTAKIAGAAVTLAKIENLAATQFLVGNGSNRPAAVAMSGDATLSNAGAVTIANNAISTAKIANAAVTLGKLANVGAGKILVGDGAGAAAAVTMSGDATLASAGGLTIANNAIISAKIADNAVINGKLAANAISTAKIQDDAVTLVKVGWVYGREKMNGSASATYDLAQDVPASHYNGIMVYRNGMLMNKAGSPSDVDEYSLSSAGGVTRVTFGAAPNNDSLTFVYTY